MVLINCVSRLSTWESRGINHRRSAEDSFIMAIRDHTTGNTSEEIDFPLLHRKHNFAKVTLSRQQKYKTSQLLSTPNRIGDTNLAKENIETPNRKSCPAATSKSNSSLIHLKKRNSSLHKSSNYSATKTIWQLAYASLVITCIFGQLSNVALASNDGISKGTVAVEGKANDIKSSLDED